MKQAPIPARSISPVLTGVIIGTPLAACAGFLVWRKRRKRLRGVDADRPTGTITWRILRSRSSQDEAETVTPSGRQFPDGKFSPPVGFGINGGTKTGIDGATEYAQTALRMLIDTGMTEDDARKKIADIMSPASAS